MNTANVTDCAWKTKDIFFLMMRNRIRKLLRDGTDIDIMTKMFNAAVNSSHEFEGYPNVTREDVRRYIEAEEKKCPEH